jgi:Ca2+-transporting ATPase
MAMSAISILLASSISPVMTGSEPQAMGDDKIVEAISEISVIARSTPMDNYMLAAALRSRGEAVAVTGDGTNYVAALLKADIGLAIGKSGTALAKEASDIVILDQNFQSIVAAVSWGRCIFNNVQRFLQFQLTENVVTLVISFMSAVILNDAPFKAVQPLWVNPIMDSLGRSRSRPGRRIRHFCRGLRGGRNLV